MALQPGTRLGPYGCPAVFLDLNGTLVLPLKVTSPSEYVQISGSAEAVARLCRKGFVCPVVTVQSRIGKGLYTEAEFLAWFRSFNDVLAADGGFLKGPYVCPHRYGVPCLCKKASGRLYRDAAVDLGIDLAYSFVIGDSLEDLEAARTLGCKGLLVRTGWQVSPAAEGIADHVADDLLAATYWITDRGGPVASQNAAALSAGTARRGTPL